MRTLVTILCLCMGTSVIAQQLGTSALTSGGATMPLPTGGTLTQAVGEMAIVTLSQGNTTLTQGVLQGDPEETQAIGELPPGVFLNLFPNPTTSTIHIETNANFLHKAHIWDVLGREVKAVPLATHSIEVSELAEGAYVLGILDASGRLRYTWRFRKL